MWGGGGGHGVIVDLQINKSTLPKSPSMKMAGTDPNFLTSEVHQKGVSINCNLIFL